MSGYQLFSGGLELDVIHMAFRRAGTAAQSAIKFRAEKVQSVWREKLRREAEDVRQTCKAPGGPLLSKLLLTQQTRIKPLPPLVEPKYRRRCETDISDSGISSCASSPTPSVLSDKSISPFLRPTPEPIACITPKRRAVAPPTTVVHSLPSPKSQWSRRGTPPRVTPPIPEVQPKSARKPLDQLSEEERTLREQRLQVKAKTSLCHDFATTGTCKYGEACRFAHTDEELRPMELHPKYKTKMCRNFVSTGHCAYGWKCQFLHKPDELGEPLSLAPLRR